MRNSYVIEKDLDSQSRLKYEDMLNYDKSEIDNPDSNDPHRLNYINRLETIISIVTRLYPRAEDCRIGDFACAQGNIGLILAEKGYKVVAVDVNPRFIEYSKLKYEKGDIEWVNGNILELNLHTNGLDIAIAGELIEHCAYPEDIVDKILEWVRPGGYLLLTTPNGGRMFIHLPRFGRLRRRQQRETLVRNQFGPSGKNHLFAFDSEDLDYIVPGYAKIIEVGYCGGTILSSPYLKTMFKFFGMRYFEATQALSKKSLLRSRICNNLYTLIIKE